jgi:hypothetical protein
MWMTPVEEMCDQHLRGEHLECHMFYGCLKKKKNVAGYVVKGFLDPRLLKLRHDAIVAELEQRGVFKNHKTEMVDVPDFSYLRELLKYSIDMPLSKAELMKRCEKCRRRYDMVSRNALL